MRVARLLVFVAIVVMLGVGGPDAFAQDSDAIDDEIVRVSTLPPTSGVLVSLDDEERITDDLGSAYFTTDGVRDLGERISVVTAEVESADEQRRSEYSRIYRIDRNHYALTFNLYVPVTFSYTGTNGEAIGIDVIQQVNIKNSIGEVIADISLDEAVWLHAQRVVSTQRGPEVREIEWSIDSVIVRDTNVVNRAQVRFFPTVEPNVNVPVLFFSAKFAVTDMFFRTPAGSAIDLTYPDGEVRTHPLDGDGRLTLASLPRGEYHVVVVGSGPPISRPVVISRNQDVDLKLLSWLDLVILGVVIVLFLAVPLAVGQRVWRLWAGWRARSEASTPDEDATGARNSDDAPNSEGLDKVRSESVGIVAAEKPSAVMSQVLPQLRRRWPDRWRGLWPSSQDERSATVESDRVAIDESLDPESRPREVEETVTAEVVGDVANVSLPIDSDDILSGPIHDQAPLQKHIENGGSKPLAAEITARLLVVPRNLGRRIERWWTEGRAAAAERSSAPTETDDRQALERSRSDSIEKQSVDDLLAEITSSNALSEPAEPDVVVEGDPMVTGSDPDIEDGTA